MTGSDVDQAVPQADPRWQHFTGGVDAGGRVVPMTYGRLARLADEWPVTTSTPDGVAGLLATSRSLWGLAWYDYNLLVVSSSWSLLAVEAALRDRLGATGKPSMQDLLLKAMKQGLLSDDWTERLDAGRQVRNGLAHARSQGSWTVGMAAPVVRAAHEATAALYPPTSRSPRSIG